MIDLNKEDLLLIFFAVSSLMESTEAELAIISPDDDQKDNFEKQLQMCKKVMDKLRGKMDFS